MSEIRGLSLTRPWPFAFTDCGKRIENRSWKPPARMIGHRLALHAAKSWSEDDRAFIHKATGLEVPERHEAAYGEIFAVCRLTGYIDSRSDPRLKPEQSKWFFGPYGWLIEDFVKLKEIVSVNGALGLWALDAGVLAELEWAWQITTGCPLIEGDIRTDLRTGEQIKQKRLF